MTQFEEATSYHIRDSHQVVTSSSYASEKFRHQQEELREDQLFTDPELLKSIQGSYNDIKGSKSGERPLSGYVNVTRQVAVKDVRLPIHFTPEAKQNNNFVIETKPAQELFVENVNVAPPTHFYYISPQLPPSPSSSRVLNHPQRTYIVNTQQQRPQSQSKTIFIQQQPPPPPIIITPPSIVKQTTTFSPGPQIVSERQIHRTASASKFNVDSVPRAEFERCQNECRIWQQKYNQLYQMYSTLSRTKDMSADDEMNQLRAENYELEQRVVMSERSDASLNQTIERHVTELINRYKGSALKETEMLFDRFRLECRQLDRDRERDQSYY